jgi:hypothetical protein
LDGSFWPRAGSRFLALAQVEGKVACESLLLCFWANKHVEFDYFNFGQRIALNAEARQAFIQEVDSHGYAALQFNNSKPLGSYRLPPAVNGATARHYAITYASSVGVLAAPARDR